MGFYSHQVLSLARLPIPPHPHRGLSRKDSFIGNGPGSVQGVDAQYRDRLVSILSHHTALESHATVDAQYRGRLVSINNDQR
jgi:hypothetical protein